MRLRQLMLAALAVLATCELARADGIDVVALLARAGPARSGLAMLGVVAAAMLVNYGLNLLVIGVPAVRAGPVGRRTVAIELVFLTLLGQVADRLGFVPAAILSVPIARAMGVRSVSGEIRVMLAINFVLAGLAIGVLALYFVRRRWHVAWRRAWRIAGFAALITNPAWAMALWFL